MKDWRDFYRKQIAPRLKARKDDMGRGESERAIAFDVQMATGQVSSRSLLAMWLRAEREPTISQFMALCDRMEVDPVEILTGRVVVKNDSAQTHQMKRKFVRNSESLNVSHGKTAARRIAKSKN